MPGLYRPLAILFGLRGTWTRQLNRLGSLLGEYFCRAFGVLGIEPWLSTRLSPHSCYWLIV